MNANIWRASGWLVSWLASFAGLFGLAWVCWMSRSGYPDGPGSTIFAGLVTYAAMTFRLMGGVGLLMFKPSQRFMLFALGLWWVLSILLMYFDYHTASTLLRNTLLVLMACAAALDLFLLTRIYKLLSSSH